MQILGELSALAAAIIWAISISLYVRFNAGQPSYVLTIFKGLITTVFLLIATLLVTENIPKNLNDYVLLILSGLIGIGVGDTASMAASRIVGAQLAGISLCLSPPLAVFMAHELYRESLNLQELFGIALVSLGCFGAVLSKGRQYQESNTLVNRQMLIWGACLILLCAFSNAFGTVAAHSSMQHTNIVHGTLIRIVPVVFIFSAFHILRPQNKVLGQSVATASLRQWVILAGIAFLGSFVGLLLFSVAAKFAKAGVVSSIVATTAVWIIPISYWLLGEKTTPLSVISSVIACAGVFLILIPM